MAASQLKIHRICPNKYFIIVVVSRPVGYVIRIKKNNICFLRWLVFIKLGNKWVDFFSNKCTLSGSAFATLIKMDLKMISFECLPVYFWVIIIILTNSLHPIPANKALLPVKKPLVYNCDFQNFCFRLIATPSGYIRKINA